MARFSENALKVLQRRYLCKNTRGNFIETADDLFRRVAKAVAKAELVWSPPSEAVKWEEAFYHIMDDLLFLPNSPTLMNAGTSLSQLSACFVLPVEDHMEKIFNALKWAALVQQSGGGTGFNFSSLRPRHDFVNGTGGSASGPVSFMKIFDAATEHIKQGGKRRGANMGILNVEHPDIEEFIVCKRPEGAVHNFNLSVGISDEFMEAVSSHGPWKLIHPNTKAVVKSIPARNLWDSMVENAWLSGDPGLVFLDTINAQNPTPQLGKMEATNPCGEVPLLPFESCNLGSINFSQFVQREKNKEPFINWEQLASTVAVATRFLDDVIEINHYLTPEMERIALGNRKIGLGIMGWADGLCKLEVPYESNEAVRLAKKTMEFINDRSFRSSVELASARGVFNNWNKSIYFPGTPVRNATRTSIAPTGTISIIANTSPSIEPLFALAYERKHVLEDETLPEINQTLLNYLDLYGLNSTNVLECIKSTGTLGSSIVPSHVKNIFKTALEIKPAWHLKHQIAFQQHTDNAVSKTINLPSASSMKDVDDIYTAAWKSKVKGITIFRDRSRATQVIHPGIRTTTKVCKICME